MGGAYAFVLWAWLNNPTKPPVPPSGTISLSATGQVNPEITWRPRSLNDLLAADSPLTYDRIRGMLQPAPSLPTGPRLAPSLYIPLTVTPNLMTPPDQEEEELIATLLHTNQL